MIAASELAKLVRAAGRDDQRAWDRLVAEYTPVLKGVARRHRLGPFDQDDVVQRTFIALVRHIGRLRDPASLPFWLSTTARRESLHILQETAREVPDQDLVDRRPPFGHDGGSTSVVDDERRDVARKAVAGLPAHQRDLLSALAVEPALSYKQVSERVGIPVGSVGPTRQRCIERMRQDPRVCALLDEHAAPGRPTRPIRPAVGLV